MAEFVEVMNKEKEICDYYGDCLKCVLGSKNNGTGYICEGLMTKFPDKAEELIMSWEEPVDWTKVKVDTPILVRDITDCEWTRRHFAKYENGRVYVWNGGSTSWTTETTMTWDYAKLAERNEECRIV